jgi:DNA (cytosine-5)-methyltransferase 1
MVVMDCGVELSGPLSARDYKDAGTDGMNKNSAKMIPVIQETVGALCADTHPGSYSGQDAYTGRLIPQPVSAYSIREDAKANTFSATELEVANALKALQPSPQSHHAQTFVAQKIAVRRLTCVECERLQGFPDHYTDIKPKGKPTSDGPRYKALGNSMAVPVMNWIGQKIQKVEDIIK